MVNFSSTWCRVIEARAGSGRLGCTVARTTHFLDGSLSSIVSCNILFLENQKMGEREGRLMVTAPREQQKCVHVVGLGVGLGYLETILSLLVRVVELQRDIK